MCIRDSSRLGQPSSDTLPSFAVRVAARLIDLLVLVLPFLGGVVFLERIIVALGLVGSGSMVGDLIITGMVWGGWWSFLRLGSLVFMLRSGQSLGKVVFGIRVVDEAQELAGFRVLMIREILGCDMFWLMFPVVAPLFDALGILGDEQQAIHDRLASTRVVWSNPQR